MQRPPTRNSKANFDLPTRGRSFVALDFIWVIDSQHIKGARLHPCGGEGEHRAVIILGGMTTSPLSLTTTSGTLVNSCVGSGTYCKIRPNLPADGNNSLAGTVIRTPTTCPGYMSK